MVRSAVSFLLAVLAAALLAGFAPLERTLGSSARLVYFHGAWVWVAMLAFLASGLAGLAGLLTRRADFHDWSQALGRAGLCFWLAFLPMSLYVMQANWNGLFLDEPRFRLPLNLAIVGVLLQAGLAFIPGAAWSSVANLIFAGVLFGIMGSIQSILHPESPIFRSSSGEASLVRIQLYFLGLLVYLGIAAWQLARLWLQWQAGRRKAGK